VIRNLPEARLIERGLSALIKELGPVEATRFLTLRRSARLDSVKRHRRWQAGLKRSRFFDQVFGPRGATR
jgi:hypothetical protein